MADKFKCWSCGQEIVVRFLKSGEEAKCRSCGQINIVPAGSTGGVPPETAFKQAPARVATKENEAELLEQVATILESRDSQKTSALEAWVMFVITLMWFVAIRFQMHFLFAKDADVDVFGLAVIIVVVLVHELGHFLAMEQLGYQDVKIYFLPLFGAATSGTNPPRDSVKRAIVLLAGPVPGILIGAACFVHSRQTGDTAFASTAETFLVINALNLLPVPPLDGGRLFDEFFFTFRPLGRVLVRIVIGIALITTSVTFNAPILALLSILPILSLKTSYRRANLARLLRTKFPPKNVSEAGIPKTCLEFAVPLVAPAHAADKFKAAAIASDISDAWHVTQSRAASAEVVSVLVACQILAIGISLWYFSQAETPACRPKSGSEATNIEVNGNRLSSIDRQLINETERPEILAPEQYLVKLRYPFPTHINLNGVFVEFDDGGRKQVLLLTTVFGLLSEEECFQLMGPGLPKTKITEDGWLLSFKHSFAIIRKEDADLLPQHQRPKYDSNFVALKVATHDPKIGDTLYCAGEYTESPRHTITGVVLPNTYYGYGEAEEQVIRFFERGHTGNSGLPILNSLNELVGLHDNLVVYQTFPLNVLGPWLNLPAKDRLMIRVNRDILEEAVKVLNRREVGISK